MKRKRILYALLLLLAAAYLGRVAWVNLEFRRQYSESSPAIGETFEDDGLRVTVTEACRTEKTEEEFLVLCRVKLENETGEERDYDLSSVSLCGDWIACIFDDALAKEWNEVENVRNTRHFTVEANSSKEILLPFVVLRRSFAADTWEDWEKIRLYLSFIQSTDRKKVYIP